MNTPQAPHSEGKYKPGDGPIGCAILGCITAGTIALIAALSMKTGLDVASCVIAATIAFAATYVIFTRKPK